MKKIVLAILFACAMVAAAQTSTQPQGQPAGGGSTDQSAPTVSGPEYNAYMGAIQQQDPAAKVSALEAFLTQYPSSVMKASALEQLIGSYQAANNGAKVVDTARRLLATDSTNLRALALLTFFSRQAVMNQVDMQKNLTDLQQYCSKGLDAVKTNKKPNGMKDEDFDKLRKDTTLLFNGGCGFAALQSKDYPNAATYLRAAVDQDGSDLQNVYALATIYLSMTPPDTLDGMFYLARAAALAAPGSPAQQQIEGYGRKIYKNYHGAEDGWADYALVTAKAATAPPADWGTKITKYVPPTPAQQAHTFVDGKTPEQIAQLSFGEWELVLSAGAPEDQDKVWSVIKGKPLQMEGNVIEATSNTELHIAASADDIEKKVADITLTMTGPIPALKMPKPSDVFDFEGTPTSYTPSPFMMMMEQGKLLRKAGEPAPKKPPVRRRPTARKPAVH